MAALDDQIRIGADQRHLAGDEVGEHVAVVFRRLDLVVEEAGADDTFSLFPGHDLDIQTVEKRQVTFGAEQVYLLRTGGDQGAGDIAGGDNAVIGRVGNADGAQLRDDADGGPR